MVLLLSLLLTGLALFCSFENWVANFHVRFEMNETLNSYPGC